MILVTGAGGKTGRRVIDRLTDAGHDYRAVGRGSVPPFVWERPDTWTAVLAGVRAAYIVHPELAATGAPAVIEEFVAAATAAGVQRLVLLSGRGETNAELSEKAVQNSGLAHTVVRAGWFAQNFTEGLLHPGAGGGVFALPAGTVREPVVDAEDIADVVTAALTDSRHDGRLYDVTGARLFTFDEMAEEIGRAAGRPVRYAPVGLEDFRELLIPHVGPDQAEMFVQLCAEVFDGRNEKPGEGIQEALGREPRDFTAFCRTAAATGVWSW
ncbi:NAD(P)H-binding protein [Actinoplanes sichuanensis]|uniref:NmrA family NAD(P)-binding protein n=1 Tax=Actinoplanes sichuanensis TaxID=512349 RepID=A0ABW4AHU6_9ACTN|nr:NmrA family NAD(P)-binding protein [Actinoplanes sichuanensis]BEL12228.1 NAD(P)H-binding protein [Actinoplanes sichuanensis]